MSSSRSVASARARRAGGDSSTSRPSQIRNAQQFTKPPPAVDNQSISDKAAPHDGKLSVSDAFALVTIRLGRVEMALQKLDIHNIAKSVDDGDTSSSIANNVVLKSLLSRIDDLEKMINEQASKVSMSPEYIELINGLQTKMDVQEKELRETKDAIYKLQSFALDVNQKISQIHGKDKQTDESEEDEKEEQQEKEPSIYGSEESVEEEEEEEA